MEVHGDKGPQIANLLCEKSADIFVELCFHLRACPLKKLGVDYGSQLAFTFFDRVTQFLVLCHIFFDPVGVDVDAAGVSGNFRVETVYSRFAIANVHIHDVISFSIAWLKIATRLCIFTSIYIIPW